MRACTDWFAAALLPAVASVVVRLESWAILSPYGGDVSRPTLF